MKIQSFDVRKVLDDVKQEIEKDKNISASLKSLLKVMIMLFEVLIERMSKNSKNSSIPPSQDPNRDKNIKKQGQKPGGQVGHTGTTLMQTKNPDKIIDLYVDLKTLPKGEYKNKGYEARQVIEIIIKKNIIEYRSHCVVDSKGKIHKAPFPENVKSPIQYGDSLKSHAVYLSMFQLIPYERLQDYFTNQLQIPISTGSLVNFNKQGFGLLETFESKIKKKLAESDVIHVDETGINIDGTRHWLHTTSNDLYTLFYPHPKRGCEALNEIDILPKFKGVAVHDHWQAYYHYNQFKHSLCNAHHIRELNHAAEIKKCVWASVMIDLLLEMKTAKEAAPNNTLTDDEIAKFKQRYKEILKDGETETPPPKMDPSKKGKIKKEKERNLLERLQNFEDDVLRFLTNPLVPFTNNLAENDLRMTKVQQKISGCFKNNDGAKTFSRIRSFILTAQKHGVSPTDALKQLFEKHTYPDEFFIDE